MRQPTQQKVQIDRQTFQTLAKTTTASISLLLKTIASRRSRLLLHGSVLALGVLMASMNVYAKTQDEVVTSQRSVLARLVFPEQDRYEIVTAKGSRETVPDSYVPSSLAVASAASAEGSLTDDIAVLAESTDVSLTDPFAIPSIGGDTLVKGLGSSDASDMKARTEPFPYQVQGGESLSGVAQKFGIDVATILQENKIYADDIVRAGTNLTILPFSGSTERVDAGETLSGIASRQGVSEASIMETNGLVTPEDLEAGHILVVKNGKRDDFLGARPRPQLAARRSSGGGSASSGSSESSGSSANSGVVPPSVVIPKSRVGNRFPWGWCTWLVAEKRGDVTWRGNANQWLANSRAQGRPTGRIPAVGSILVTNESWWGHVAYVEAVNGDQVTVTEMNYKGFGITSRRTLSNRSGVIRGYIY